MKRELVVEQRLPVWRVACENDVRRSDQGELGQEHAGDDDDDGDERLTKKFDQASIMFRSGGDEPARGSLHSTT